MTTRLSNTQIEFECPFDAVVTTLNLSTLEAGTDWNPYLVEISPLTCGHVWYLNRSNYNATELAGGVNTLHAGLVTAAQINANWVAYFAGEPAINKPAFNLTVGASPVELRRSVKQPGFWAKDPVGLTTIYAPSQLQPMVESGAVLLAGNDATIAGFVASLWSSPADRTRVTDFLIALRDDQMTP